MNPYSNAAPPPYSAPDLQDNSHDAPVSPSVSPPLVQTGQSSLTRSSPPSRASWDQRGGPSLFRSPSSALPGFSVRAPAANPYPAPSSAASCCHVSVIIPDAGPRCSEDSCPDLECSICFSQFNNVFRCPKMLQCQHTFCLECLARINVKSAEPNAIQCPLCRSFTPLPALGLPKLDTDSDVLSCLPAAMQRVYSIRFVRNKGKLQVKRPAESQRRWGRRSLASLRSVNRSLDVGLPSPPAGGGGGEAGGMGGALFRLTGQPACRAFLLTSVVMMLVILTGIIIFLITFRDD
ncbi:E3 ubiquitin-protein ligase TRIM33 [Stegastes partitus]|uniref:E3 ubiquitin-protein ligase TRIM33 n=1 Tax=Stegastes partitus TaxID=144197 RepID=A0A9Y4TRU0_9TELE|nr:PREDICTED: E3 ubiquitin-protein ligase TRIM33-like [Stegastes partitus]